MRGPVSRFQERLGLYTYIWDAVQERFDGRLAKMKKKTFQPEYVWLLVSVLGSTDTKLRSTSVCLCCNLRPRDNYSYPSTYPSHRTLQGRMMSTTLRETMSLCVTPIQCTRTYVVIAQKVCFTLSRATFNEIRYAFTYKSTSFDILKRCFEHG